MNNKTSYRILKLVNGDDIIGEVIENTSKSLSIYRPYQMKIVTISDTDENVLFQTEVLLMRNWLSMTDEIKSIIIKNHIISISSPKESVIKCYEEEKKKEDEPDFLYNDEDLKENTYEFNIGPEDIQRILDDIIKSKEVIPPSPEDDTEDDEECYFEEDNTTYYEGQDTDKDMFGS